jgi:hypothetical protein
LSLARGILLGTLIVGVLDALDAIVVFGLRSGVAPDRIFRGIAAGVVGPAARAGGAGTAVFGVALHFTVAFGIVATFVLLSRQVPALRRRPWLVGPIYGLAVFAVMNLVVIPMSAIGASPQFDTLGLVNGLAIHVFGVGLPAALVAAKVAHPRDGL